MAAAAYSDPVDDSAKPPASQAQPLHSPWHSPVPYLFGGLAAMLGLIAFALLILACSYWKLSGYLEGDGDGERNLEAGDSKLDDQTQKTPIPYEEKILVIMAGQEKPTFLATPMWSSRSSSFGDNTTTCCSCDKNAKSELHTGETTVKPEEISGHDQVQSENRGTTPETSHDQSH
ncbi:protein GLUTAMINE DUMPER 3-like [Prosopis cineraria]|uniref:protein GLUTAMINE DUMPER 3-like n=1 Tax=Prosopis cineraria TaxID=364024 RepID=UPI00240F75C5|nr:protein GLUTAMINE DUMPER 3-like [Prosopis cineraria]XP_054821884.1 protein GLUTAMINE DUMPER 3-like [Prosopis cineraria]